MGWPQITIIALATMGLGIHLAKASEPRAPYSPGSYLIAIAIEFSLLWAGGFFS